MRGKPAGQQAELTPVQANKHTQADKLGTMSWTIVTNDSCWQLAGSLPPGSLPPGSSTFSLRFALKRDNGPLSPRFCFSCSSFLFLSSFLFHSCPCHSLTLLNFTPSFCTSTQPSPITMSGLILNCLLPFVRPPRTVSVQEAQNMSTADYLDAASDQSISNSLIQPQRVDHQRTGLFLLPLFKTRAQTTFLVPEK